MRGNETLNQITTLLRELGGYFTFIAENGEEYIVAAKKDVTVFGSSNKAESELQLPLPPATANQAAAAANELLDHINRDIAMYQAAQEQFSDDELTDGEVIIFNPGNMAAQPPPRRVRFEPLRGDLPPELQE